MSVSKVIIKPAITELDYIIAEHFYQLWLDNHVSQNQICDDWLDITLKFIDHARQELKFQAFIAQIETEIVGSVSCHLFAGLYPNIRRDRNYGYIWNVYVKTEFRRQGIATELTNTAIDYLKSIDCNKAVLHASPFGKSVYENIGFIPNNEMILDLI